MKTIKIMKIKGWCGIFIILIILTSFMAKVFATEIERKIAGDEVLQEDFYFAGQNAINKGNIKGDFIAIGQQIESSGTIEGDYIGAAQQGLVSGKVLGDIRFAGQNFGLSGLVGKNVNIFAQNVAFKDESEVSQNVIIFAQTVDISGKVKGSAKIFSQNVKISGSIDKDVEINIGNEGSVEILPSAKILGKLTYKSTKEIAISSEAKINQTEWIQIPKEEMHKSDIVSEKKYDFSEILWILLGILLNIGIGLLLIKLFPRSFSEMTNLIKEKSFKPIVIGFVSLALILPVIITTIIISVILFVVTEPFLAITFSSILASIYFTVIYLSVFPVSLWFGGIVLKGKYSASKSFMAGFVIISFVNAVLEMLSQLHFSFSILNGILTAAIAFVGIGCIINVLKQGLCKTLAWQKMDDTEAVKTNLTKD